MSDTIYLDADLFMALGLSAEAHGGMGRGDWFDDAAHPYCAEGHALWLDGVSRGEGLTSQAVCDLVDAGLHWERNDVRMARRKITEDQRIPFVRWLRIVNVDVQ